VAAAWNATFHDNPAPISGSTASASPMPSGKLATRMAMAVIIS
jgi:hypothetical protein